MHVTATATTRERAARHKRSKVQTLTPDMRTRLAKRAKALQREYTGMLVARGVAVDVFTEATINNLSIAMTQIETARAASSRGVPTDPELMRAWVTTAMKLARALGLKPSIVEASPPPRPSRPLSAALRDGMVP
jgi:hypothetical protein